MRQSFLFSLAALLGSSFLAVGSSVAQELSCPPMPDKVTQVNHDILTDVQVDVGPLSKLKVGQVGAKSEVVAKNLFGKYPNIDRMFLAQMMGATYCSMIQDSKTVKDAEKLRLWREFSDRVFRFADPSYSPPSPVPGAKPKEKGASAQTTKTDNPPAPQATPPSQSCPNGICIGGENSGNPTVNNFGPPPIQFHWDTQVVVSTKPEFPYETKVVVSVSDNYSPVSLAFICDVEVQAVNFDFGAGGFVFLNVEVGVPSDYPKVGIVRFGGSPITPDQPMNVYLWSKEPLHLLNVMPAKIMRPPS